MFFFCIFCEIARTFWLNCEIELIRIDVVYQCDDFHQKYPICWLKIEKFRKTLDDASKSIWIAKQAHHWLSYNFQMKKLHNKFHQNIRAVYFDPKASCKRFQSEFTNLYKKIGQQQGDKFEFSLHQLEWMIEIINIEIITQYIAQNYRTTTRYRYGNKSKNY